LSISGNQSIPGVGGVWVIQQPRVPVQVQGCHDLNPGSSNNRLLNVNAFTEPALFHFGNTYQLPHVRQCGYKDEDISIDKSVAINERSRMNVPASASA
jgi:hypothetical protein